MCVLLLWNSAEDFEQLTCTLPPVVIDDYLPADQGLVAVLFWKIVMVYQKYSLAGQSFSLTERLPFALVETLLLPQWEEYLGENRLITDPDFSMSHPSMWLPLYAKFLVSPAADRKKFEVSMANRLWIIFNPQALPYEVAPFDLCLLVAQFC